MDKRHIYFLFLWNTSLSNQYDEVKEKDFQEYFDLLEETAIKIEPLKIHQIIQGMNKKAATVPGDIPMKLVEEFSDEIAFPLAHIINNGLKTGQYPVLWKNESITPAPKLYPPEKIADLGKISGLLVFSKVADKIIGEFLIHGCHL